MKTGKTKNIVILPAYNAVNTMEKTISDIPKEYVDDIICVDDGSIDGTYELAKTLNLKVFKHPQNRGYGANQKTCYDKALEMGADIVIMLHPDYQYDPKLVPHFITYISEGYFDIIMGSRIRTRKEALENGMPRYKYLGNRFLTLIENIITGQNLSEYHTGYRAYSRTVLETIPYKNNSDDFVFDQELLIQAAFFNFKIAEIPVPVRYFPEASSINFKRSVKYGISTILLLGKYLLHKFGIFKSKLFIPNPDKRIL